MPNNSKELQDILYRILRILLSTQVTLWVVWRQIQRGYALFLYNAKLVRQMPNNNKQATKAKNSNLLRTITLGSLVAVSLPLLIADADSTAILLLTKVAGIALLALASTLYNRWYGNDFTEYSNEFIPNSNDR